jgi:anti-anti-sigma regulatory factor
VTAVTSSAVAGSKYTRGDNGGFQDRVRGDAVYGIEVRAWGERGVVIKLEGEFDQDNLTDLQETLSGVVSLRRPTWVDLSRVTFLDVGATRELTIRSRLYAHHLTLCNPSWQVRKSVAACGFEEWIDFSCQHSYRDRPEPEAGEPSLDEEALPTSETIQP